MPVRTMLLCLCFLFGTLLGGTLSNPASAQTAPSSAGAPDPELIADLVTANRILSDQGVVDGFGHVSARHDKNPQHFLLARSMAPALVAAEDIMEFDQDGNPVDARGRRPYLERFIHAEIYKLRPDVKAVVHSHSPGIIPFGASGVPLRPIYHMSGFLGAEVPVFDIRQAAGMTDMLVRTPELGRSLAQALGGNAVVLMRGHGSTAVGISLKQVVYRAIYTEANARLQAEAMKLGPVTFLDPQEAAKAAETNDGQLDRPWELWKSRAIGIK